MKAPNTRGEEWSALEDDDCSQWQVCTQGEVVATGIFSKADAKMMAASKEMAKILWSIYMADKTGNNGAIMGEAVLSRHFSTLARHALLEAGYTEDEESVGGEQNVVDDQKGFDNTQAFEEGWGLFNDGEIQRLDLGPIVNGENTGTPAFASDAEALAHVRLLADRDNSKYHKIALSLLKPIHEES